jgi:hypothetical protein
MKDPDDWPPAAGPLPAQVRSILAEVMSKLVADVRDGSYEDLDDYLSTATGAIFADEGPLDLTLRQAQRWRVLYSAVQALHDEQPSLRLSLYTPADDGRSETKLREAVAARPGPSSGA